MAFLADGVDRCLRRTLGDLAEVHGDDCMRRAAVGRLRHGQHGHARDTRELERRLVGEQPIREAVLAEADDQQGGVPLDRDTRDGEGGIPVQHGHGVLARLTGDTLELRFHGSALVPSTLGVPFLPEHHPFW